jgi:DNA-binding NtrC family response regulator
MRIICVEDDNGLRNVIVDTLHFLDPDANIDVFANSDDVLPAVRLSETSLVLLDVRIPGAMNGYGLAQRLRESGYAGILALMSAFPRPPESFLDQLNCEWLAKPIDVDTLDGLVGKALSSQPPA